MRIKRAVVMARVIVVACVVFMIVMGGMLFVVMLCLGMLIVPVVMIKIVIKNSYRIFFVTMVKIELVIRIGMLLKIVIMLTLGMLLMAVLVMIVMLIIGQRIDPGGGDDKITVKGGGLHQAVHPALKLQAVQEHDFGFAHRCGRLWSWCVDMGVPVWPHQGCQFDMLSANL